MRKFSLIHRKRLGLAKQGKKLVENHKEAIRQSVIKAHQEKQFGFISGFSPWNKGKKGVMPLAWNKGMKGMFRHTEETKRKMSEAHKGKNTWTKGRKLTDEQKEKLKGKIPWNKGKKMREESKKKLSETLKNHFKNGKAVWNKGKKYLQITGEKCHLWRGGISQKNRTERGNIMSMVEYKNWRRAVFEKDNYQCVNCGEMGGYLEADHIKSFKDFPELRFEVNNGQTLCKNCHNLKTFNRKNQPLTV